MKIPKAGIVRRPRELDAFCRTVVERLNALEEFHTSPDDIHDVPEQSQPVESAELAPEPEAETQVEPKK